MFPNPLFKQRSKQFPNLTQFLESMLLRDPSLKERIDHAFAYAIFPGVGKGAFVVGGAFGRGIVVEKVNLRRKRPLFAVDFAEHARRPRFAAEELRHR